MLGFFLTVVDLLGLPKIDQCTGIDQPPTVQCLQGERYAKGLVQMVKYYRPLVPRMNSWLREQNKNKKGKKQKKHHRRPLRNSMRFRSGLTRFGSHPMPHSTAWATQCGRRTATASRSMCRMTST